jgi:hypothetical protein
MRKIPYGLSDFKRVLEEDYLYIDKTSFIHDIEDESDFLYFLRPRRFGKSLTISMLEAYYDVYYKDRFESIFKNTYIYKNPTKKQNSFYVLKFNFSAVDTTDYESSFRHNINSTIKLFCDIHNLNITMDTSNPIDNMKTTFEYCFKNNLPIYILIDEYDNFVTKLLVSDMNAYKNIVTTKNAIYKEFFTMLKVGTESAVKKIFITGVSPLAMYDVSSGSNIGKNISLSQNFNNMVGVTKPELNNLIELYNLHDKKERITDICNQWYNSYRFHKDVEHTIYNSDMILYYFDHLIRYNQEPDDLIDVNVRTDYTKLRYLVYTNKKLNGNFEMLNNLIIGNKITTSKIKDNFSAFELANEENFKSFMFSLGFMTLKKELFQLKLSIPNQTIQKLLSEFIHYGYSNLDDYNISTEKINEQLANLAINKDLSVFKYISNAIKESSSIRDFIDGENFVKAYMLCYLNLSNFYALKSEVEINKGYADIVLEPIKEEVPYGVIIELKYISRTQKNYEEVLKNKIKEAKKQLVQYDLGEKYIKIVLVFKGWEMVYCELCE